MILPWRRLGFKPRLRRSAASFSADGYALRNLAPRRMFDYCFGRRAHRRPAILRATLAIARCRRLHCLRLVGRHRIGGRREVSPRCPFRHCDGVTAGNMAHDTATPMHTDAEDDDDDDCDAYDFADALAAFSVFGFAR